MTSLRGCALALLVILAGCQKAAPSAPQPAPPPAPAPAGHLKLIPAPDYPDAAVVIADQKVQSEAAHRALLVYEGATWCEPCRRLHAAAEKGELDAALPGVDFLVFDADRDGERLKAAGYTSRFVPLLAVPGADGRATGRQTEGAIEGPKMVDQLVARIQVMLKGE